MKWLLGVSVALGLAGCNLAFDPDQVPRPCVPACAGKTCGADDGCGTACTPGGATPGCTPACTPSCAQRFCGTDDGCGSPCAVDGGTPGCTPITGLHTVTGSRLTAGAGAVATDGGYSVQQGQVGSVSNLEITGGHSAQHGGVTP